MKEGERMAWVNIKCPHCGGIAKKATVNSSVTHQTYRISCQSCHKPVVYENNGGKVKVYKG